VASNSGDEMFVVNFNEKVSLGLPRGDRFTGSPAELKGAISRTQANGKTALYDAIAVSLSQLQEGDSDKKVLLVISDGGDNASSHSLSEVLRIAGQSDAIIYTIGLFDKDSTDRNPKALESLARATGGEAFFPKETASVVAICRQIAKDIRSQYTLGYSPTPASTESAYRTIRVVASAPHYANLSVRTRAGYIPANRTRRQTDSTGRGK
jgi:Ca-activated chloride channel family protein